MFGSANDMDERQSWVFYSQFPLQKHPLKIFGCARRGTLNKTIFHRAQEQQVSGQDNISFHKRCLRTALYMHMCHAVPAAAAGGGAVCGSEGRDEVIRIVKKKESIPLHTHVKVVSRRKTERATCYSAMNHDTSISCIAVLRLISPRG